MEPPHRGGRRLLRPGKRLPRILGVTLQRTDVGELGETQRQHGEPARHRPPSCRSAKRERIVRWPAGGRARLARALHGVSAHEVGEDERGVESQVGEALLQSLDR